MKPEVGVKNQISIWVEASRPRTLRAAVTPVVIGTAAASGIGAVRPGLAGFALLSAILIQVGTNFVNDLGDGLRGADEASRLGPPRAVGSGAVLPGTMRNAAVLAFSAAALAGLPLVYAGGWPILLVGVASILAGIAYTAGPKPLAWVGLGDCFVFVFFGLVATLGAEWVQVGRLDAAGALGGIGAGALATAILVVNNLRDVEGDALVGKRTLVVRLGQGAGRRLWFALVVLAFAVPLFGVGFGLLPPATLLSLCAVPLAWSPAQRVRRGSGAALAPALGETARLQLIYGLIFALGLVKNILW